MNQIKLLKHDVTAFIKIYGKQERNLKVMDLISLGCLFLALVNFLVLQIFNIGESSTNAILIIYPIFISGLTVAFRRKINETQKNNEKLLKLYAYSCICVTVPALIAVVFFLV